MTKLTTINGKLRRYTGSSGYNLVYSKDDYTGCCCKACLCYGSSSIWGDGGLEITSSTNLDSLCLIVAGTLNTCYNEFPGVFPAAAIQAWVTSGGILAIKTEFPGPAPSCGDIPEMNAYLSSIGSNMTLGSERIACGGDTDPPGYVGALAALPVTAGMGATINSGGASAAISGGTAIVTAPACPSFSGGVSLAGEQKGAGVIFLTGDSNIDAATQFIINNAVNIQQNGGNYF